MKILSLIILPLLACTALGSAVGDSYQKVLSDKGKPVSQMEAGTVRILKYADVTIKFKDNVVTAITPVAGSAAPAPVAVAAPPTKEKTPTDEEKATAAKKGIEVAVARVNSIVNQPVTKVPRTPTMKLADFGPAWFHPGAMTPDFSKVDVRASQQMIYDKYPYVTSDLNPGVAFVGQDLEFNPMTKLFYTDLNLPKKKLTEREMLEINQQYRLIAQYREQLKVLQVPPN